MKILTIITRGDSIGGAQTHVLSISKMLQDEGNEVIVCIGGCKNSPFTDLLIRHEIKYEFIQYLKRPISPINDLLAVFEIKRLVDLHSPDIITLHSTKAGIIGRLCKLFFINRPVVVTIHGWAFTTGVSKVASFFYKIIERLLGNLADKIIVVSNFDRELAIKNFITLPQKLVTIHNGIPIKNSQRIDSRKNKSVLNLVMIARFDNQKDHATLLNACKDIPNIRIDLLGDGPGEEKIKLLVEKLGMTEKVTFWGYTRDVSTALISADIFLLISNWEGFPISTLEAMNYYLPIVVSNVGGASEAVIDGYNGFCIPRGAVEVLAQKITILINDESLRIQMGKNSKAKLIENFSDKTMYQKTYQVYKEVITK